MELKKKIALVSIVSAMAIIVAIAYLTDSWPGNGFFLMAGAVGMIGGACYAILALLLLLLKDKRYAFGFFISAAALIILGFAFFKILPGY